MILSFDFCTTFVQHLLICVHLSDHDTDLKLFACKCYFMFFIFSTRQHIAYMLIALYAIARPSVCPSVRWVNHTKTVEVRIMKFPPYGSPVLLVFVG